MEASNGIVSSFASVRENVSSTSFPAATKYHARAANSSRCSSSTMPHNVALGVGLRDTGANEVAMLTLLVSPWRRLNLIESRIVPGRSRVNRRVLSCNAGFGRSWFDAAEPCEGIVHRILHTRVWTMQHASYPRYRFGESIAIRLIS